MNLSSKIRDIVDFPKEGVVFKDITPILQDPKYLNESINQMEEQIKDLEFVYIIGPESRGFIFGVPLACKMNKGFIPVRKKGKLPYETKAKEYSLEYGTATIEIHIDAIKPGQKVVIADDLLATGGTSRAIVDLIEEMGGEIVGFVYLIELEFLDGRKLLDGYNIKSLIKY